MLIFSGFLSHGSRNIVPVCTLQTVESSRKCTFLAGFCFWTHGDFWLDVSVMCVEVKTNEGRLRERKILMRGLTCWCISEVQGLWISRTYTAARITGYWKWPSMRPFTTRLLFGRSDWRSCGSVHYTFGGCCQSWFPRVFCTMSPSSMNIRQCLLLFLAYQAMEGWWQIITWRQKGRLIWATKSQS